MDIGIQQITSIIIASSTSYFVMYSPIFLFIGGLALAIAVLYNLFEITNSQKNDM